MRQLLSRAAPIARSNAPVVILGETGTGKEVLARTLHAEGPRARREFVAVNCGAMPADLIESELFGHARGAFSGAVTEKRGLFEEASGGTILLDEIADLPLPVQVKLLRVLQQGEIRRVGATRTTAVDVRVIAATHRDLTGLVHAGAFREDLYYRLKVFTLRLPSLRERPEDILPLARNVLAQVKAPVDRLGPCAERALLAHGWPGNVRELVNAMQHAAALVQGPYVAATDLPEEVTQAERPHGSANGAAHARDGLVSRGNGPPVALEPLAVVERRYILAVVEACAGNQAEAARILGVARNTLWRKLESYARERDAEAARGSGGC